MIATRSIIRGVSFAAVLATSFGLAQTGAMAQQKKAAAPAAPAAAEQSVWVKLCENVTFQRQGPDGKPAKDERKMCLTQHENISGNTGLVIVSAAIREFEGGKDKDLLIMVPVVPYGVALPPGLKAAFYTKEQWAKVDKNEKLGENDKPKQIELKFSNCHPVGCTAEIDATDEIIKDLSNAGGIGVIGFTANAQPVFFKVSLAGFQQALAGAPFDNKQYAEARGAMMKQIRERQVQMIEQAKAKQAAPAAAPAAKKQ